MILKRSDFGHQMHFEGMASKHCTFDAVLTSLRLHGIILLLGAQ